MSRGWSGPRRRRETAVDRGLQAERTTMAWQRTALGLGGVSALLLHRAAGNPLAALPGIAGMLVALGLLVVVERRYDRTVRRVAAGEVPAGPVLIRTVAAASVALALAALTLVAAGPG
ncbi:MAG TPA: DUF202 domain-containing protein [Nocardioides sp.]|uniref:DUF202 domain-containing protein n=1 Tax=Nocardioides sp. TaxID=35761 RepID=UPI002CC58403|nr:DUF202 domain-containing protein [Nocardioides sp.]HQR25415.1 DUF202 domain-containing protein [Nocardioides sp.]